MNNGLKWDLNRTVHAHLTGILAKGTWSEVCGREQNDDCGQPQRKPGKIQPNPPRHTIDDVVILATHKTLSMFLRLGRLGVCETLAPLVRCFVREYVFGLGKVPQSKHIKGGRRVRGMIDGVC